VLDGPESICPGETTTVEQLVEATIPPGGGLAIEFIEVSTGDGVNLTDVDLPYTFDNDLNGLLSANDFDIFEGEYELTAFVYSDPNNVAGSVCATADAALTVFFLSADDPLCSPDPEPCTDWQDPNPTGGWTNFNTEFGGAPCDDGGGCPFNEIEAFEVFAAEAYSVDNFMEGGTYTFSMCNGPGAGSWVPDFTIIAPSGEVDAFGPGDGDGCSITWTASESGTYLIVINELGSCGEANAIGNGYPALTCEDGTAPCDVDGNCTAPPLVVVGESEICPDETATLEILESAEIPAGGGIGVQIEIPAGDVYNISDITFPYEFDNDLNGVLSANGVDPLEGNILFSTIVYSNAGDVSASICSTSITDVSIEFFGPDSEECQDEAPCSAAEVVLTGITEICPGDSTSVDLQDSAEVPDGGGVGLKFTNTSTNEEFNLGGVSFPYEFDNDLNGVLSANGITPFQGVYEVRNIVYSDLLNVSGTICSVSDQFEALVFLEVDDPDCVTGIADLEEHINWEVYPNPADDRMQISLSGSSADTYELHIFDINSRQVFSEQFVGSTSHLIRFRIWSLYLAAQQ
jgi:hypothetical protein